MTESVEQTMIEWLERRSYTAACPLSLSPDDIERIIECVGFPVEQAKRVILQRWLNWSVSNYRSDRADPTPANMRNRLAAIAKRAQSLLETLEVEDDSVALLVWLEIAADDEFTEEQATGLASGGQRLQEAVRGVQALQRWAAGAMVDVKKNVKRRGKTPDYAREIFMASSAKIYRYAFSRKPGVSRSSKGKPGGPFVRFIDACLREIDENLSPETVATWAHRGIHFDGGTYEDAVWFMKSALSKSEVVPEG